MYRGPRPDVFTHTLSVRTGRPLGSSTHTATYGAVVAIALLRRDLEIDRELEPVVPLRRGDLRRARRVAPECGEAGHGERDAGQSSERAAAVELNVLTYVVHSDHLSRID
jgi:hypothetical protein